MNDELSRLLDRLVPRGGKVPSCLYVTLEEYLARVANFHLKISGVDHRRETWIKICQEHVDRFEKSASSFLDADLGRKIDIRSYALTDRR